MIPRPSEYLLYSLKRWTLVVLCLISIVLAVVFSFMAKDNVKEILDLGDDIAPADLAAKKSEMIARLFIATAIMSIFKVTGICAALFENIWATNAFIIFNIINCLMVFGVALISSLKWINFFITLLIMLVAILYWIDLKRAKILERTSSMIKIDV